MTIADTVIGLVVAALPGASLWEQSNTPPAAGDLLVFDSVVPPAPPTRYVVVYPDPGTRSPGPGQGEAAVCDESTSEITRWQVTCVAPDRQMAGWLAQRIRDQMVDTRIAVDGYSPGLVRHTFAQLPQRDEQVLERPVIFAVDQYRLLAERVPAVSS